MNVSPYFQGMHELPDYNKITFPENPPIPFEEVVPDASPEALALLKKFLVYQSKKRISAKEVGLTISSLLESYSSLSPDKVGGL